jgi:hypothetical protein
MESNGRILFFVNSNTCRSAWSDTVKMLCEKYGLVYQIVDVVSEAALYKTWKVRGWPTILYVKEGKEVGRSLGAPTYNSLKAVFKTWGIA